MNVDAAMDQPAPREALGRTTTAEPHSPTSAGANECRKDLIEIT